MRGEGTIGRRAAGRELHAALIAMLLSGGCSLLVGSELSGKPAEATGGGAGGQGESSAQSSSVQVGSGPATSAGGAGSSSAAGTSSSSAAGPSSSSASAGSGGPMCPDDFADCDGKAENGCETDLATDKRNCGVCNHKCMGGEKCNQKQCG